MPLKAKCRCGRVLKVRESMAGKRVRCPECESPVRIPEPEPVYDDFDDYGDDFGEEDEDPYAAPPPRTRKKKSGKKKSKSSGGGVPIPLLIGGCVFAGLIGVGVMAYVLLSRDSDRVVADAGSAGATDTDSSVDDATGGGTQPASSTSASEQPDSESFWNGGVADPEDATTSSVSATPASSGTPPSMATPASTASASSPDVWVVLSNFRDTTPTGSIGKVFQVDYRVASGAPQAGRNYVLYIGSSMGMMERYNEVEINLNSNGTVQIPGGLGMSGETRAYVAWKQGRQKWQPVSGKIKVGGQPTAAKRPPTVTEAAGAAAQGKLIALANPRFEQNLGRQALVVDYVLQNPFEAGKRYFLVVKGNGDPVRTDVTTNLMRATQGEKSRFGVRVMGPGGFPKGTLTIHVERRIGLFTRNSETPDIVSNSTRLNR